MALCVSAHAQVYYACTPQPIVTMSPLGKAVMGEWGCFLINQGSAVRLLTPEEFYSAIIKIRPLTPNVATQVLNDRQARTAPARVVNVMGKIVKPLGPVAGSAITIISKSNAVTGLIIAVSSQVFPSVMEPIVGIAQSQVPSITPYTQDLFAAPVALAPIGLPGSTATKVVFAAKQHDPMPVEGIIR